MTTLFSAYPLPSYFSWLTRVWEFITQNAAKPEPSPAERLPVELLLMIFESLIPQSHDVRELSAVTASAGVCRQWRRVALATPALWTYVTVNPSLSRKKNQENRYDRYIECLGLQFKRTESNLLNIKWHHSGEVYDDGIMRVVSAYAPVERWRSLRLMAASSTKSPRHPFSMYSHAGFSHLEELYLYGQAPLPQYFAELVERTALDIQYLEAGVVYYCLLDQLLPKTSKRVKKCKPSLE